MVLHCCEAMLLTSTHHNSLSLSDSFPPLFLFPWLRDAYFFKCQLPFYFPATATPTATATDPATATATATALPLTPSRARGRRERGGGPRMAQHGPRTARMVRDGLKMSRRRPRSGENEPSPSVMQCSLRQITTAWGPGVCYAMTHASHIA